MAYVKQTKPCESRLYKYRGSFVVLHFVTVDCKSDTLGYKVVGSKGLCVWSASLFYLIGLTLLGLLNFILFYFFLFFCSFEVIMQREGKGTCCALVGTFNGYGFTLIETRFWAVLVCLENLKCLCCPSTPKAFFFSFDVILCQCLHFFFPPLDEVYIANVQTNGIQNSDAVARWTPWCYRVSKPLVCVPVGLSWPAFVWNSDPSYTNKALQHVL